MRPGSSLFGPQNAIESYYIFDGSAIILVQLDYKPVFLLFAKANLDSTHLPIRFAMEKKIAQMEKMSRKLTTVLMTCWKCTGQV